MQQLKTVLLTTATVMVPFIVSAQSGIIARYQLNNNATDSVGFNHGTVLAANPTTDRFGLGLAAYNFNGTSSRIEFNAPPPFPQVTNWTIAAWVKPATTSQNGLAVYIGFDNGDVSNGFGF